MKYLANTHNECRQAIQELMRIAGDGNNLKTQTSCKVYLNLEPTEAHLKMCDFSRYEKDNMKNLK